MPKPELIVRNYSPEVDYPSTVECLRNTGFYHLLGVKRELWTPDGQPIPDLPIGDDFIVTRLS